MSSEYTVLCLSHTPVLVTDITMSGHGNCSLEQARALINHPMSLHYHPDCNLAIGHFSGGLTKVGFCNTNRWLTSDTEIVWLTRQQLQAIGKLIPLLERSELLDG